MNVDMPAGLAALLDGTTRPDAPPPFRLPIEEASEGVTGTIAAGQVRVGDKVVAALSGRGSTVTSITGPDGAQNSAGAGEAVTLTLAEPIDLARGDMLAPADAAPEVADQFAAHIAWADGEDMLPERTYQIRISGAEATAQITDLVHKIDANTQETLAAKTLEAGETGYCKLALDNAVAFDGYADCRPTGQFMLLDRFTGDVVGRGVIDFALRRASNIEWHEMKVDKGARARANAQTPCVLWFTGFSGSGKSTVADALEQKLHAQGKRTYLLDGDNVRHGLNKDLGFTDQDRVENIRRVAEVAKLMVDAGLIVLTSFISPFRAEREMLEAGEFVEVFVDTPLQICEARDPKGLYKKARSGELKNFTGIDSDYEVPEAAEITLKAGIDAPEAMADQIIQWLNARGMRG